MLKARTIVSGLGALAMVMLVCGSVMGVVIVEDFESPDVVGNPPTPTSAPTPYWFDGNVGGNVFTTPIVVQETPEAGNLTQFYKDPGYEGSTVSGAQKDWVFAPADDMPEEFTFEIDVFGRNVHIHNELVLLFREAAVGGYGVVGLSLDQNEIRIRNGNGTKPVLVGTWQESAWQNINMHVNTTSKDISVSLDGATPVVTTYTTEGAPAQADRLLATRFGGNPAFYYLDNLKLTTGPIPEPGTLALLGLGGAVLLRRRRTV